MEGLGSTFNCHPVTAAVPRTCCMAGDLALVPSSPVGITGTRGWVNGIGHCSDLHCQQWKCPGTSVRRSQVQLNYFTPSPKPGNSRLWETHFQCGSMCPSGWSPSAPCHRDSPCLWTFSPCFQQGHNFPLTPLSSAPLGAITPPRHWGFHDWKFVRFIKHQALTLWIQYPKLLSCKQSRGGTVSISYIYIYNLYIYNLCLYLYLEN